MSAPTREDLDTAIAAIAARLVKAENGGSVFAALSNRNPQEIAALSGAVSADAASLSALLAYRAAQKPAMAQKIEGIADDSMLKAFERIGGAS